MKDKRLFSLDKLIKPLENAEDNKLRVNMVRLFGKYDVRNEKQFIRFGKWLVFSILIVVEILLLVRHLDLFQGSRDWTTLSRLLSLMGTLTISQALKLFVIKQNRHRIVFYVLDALVACLFVFFSSDIFSITIYILVLTQFYLNFERTKSSVTLFIISAALYGIFTFLQQLLLVEGPLHWPPLLLGTFEAVFVLLVHFVVVQVAWAFYRQFLKLDETLKELDASKKELEKAYEAVVEVTALEERQRIAKDIHDSAGHSLTTVIMQTEAAKLIIDSNPKEAKGKIVAANLQAKHALEELRNSVHLLSGGRENETLQSALLDIIHDTMDGTGIIVRSEIEEIYVSETKFRFICNTLKEGISNGLRHGGATAFWFELKQTDDKIEFLLSDNGKGVDKQQLCVGFGLSSMMERAKLFGGFVGLESEEGEGFELRMILPADVREQ